jgi:hypothetical protein
MGNHRLPFWGVRVPPTSTPRKKSKRMDHMLSVCGSNASPLLGSYAGSPHLLAQLCTVQIWIGSMHVHRMSLQLMFHLMFVFCAVSCSFSWFLCRSSHASLLASNLTLSYLYGCFTLILIRDKGFGRQG